MTKQEKIDTMMELLAKLQVDIKCSKEEIISAYGTFDKFILETKSKISSILDYGSYETNDPVPQPLQPIYINGPAEIHITPIQGMFGPYA